LSNGCGAGEGGVTFREEIIGDARLILGDCLAVLPTLAPVDHVISDPPFEAEAHTLQRRKLGRSLGSDREIVAAPLSFSAITPEQRDNVAREAARVARGWLLAFCQAEAVQAWRQAVEAAGGSYRRAMVWIKPDGMPQYSGDRPGMGYESIVAAWCGEGRSRWNGGGRHGVFTVNKGEGAGPNLHETQKPLRLMRELVQLFTAPGETVLDPFMGSASTGVAALQLGRAFIGIEREPRYFDIACRRIEEAQKQGDLLRDILPKSKPTQEALL
jgi:DNA modification methylase